MSNVGGLLGLDSAAVQALIDAVDNTVGSETAGSSVTAIDATTTLVDGGVYIAHWYGVSVGATSTQFGITLNGESGANYKYWGQWLSASSSPTQSTGFLAVTAGVTGSADEEFSGICTISCQGTRGKYRR